MLAANEGIVAQLERDCLDSGVSASTILRKAKVIASKLDLQDLKDWIDSELSGYECSMEELPAHRKGIGAPKFYNPYHGWRPIMTDDGWLGRTIRTVYLPQPVAELEEMAQGGASDTLVMDYHPVLEQAMQKQLPARMQCGLHFSKSQIRSALEFVRNRTLDWSLELQTRGISGEGHSFAAADKKEARMVTNNIYGGNIGVLGDVAGNATTSRFVNSGGIDAASLRTFLEQAIPAANGLDEQTRYQVRPLLDELKQEVENEKRPSKVRALLGSIRATLEGAGGSLVASAILGALTGSAI